MCGVIELFTLPRDSWETLLSARERAGATDRKAGRQVGRPTSRRNRTREEEWEREGERERENVRTSHVAAAGQHGYTGPSSSDSRPGSFPWLRYIIGTPRCILPYPLSAPTHLSCEYSLPSLRLAGLSMPAFCIREFEIHRADRRYLFRYTPEYSP